MRIAFLGDTHYCVPRASGGTRLPLDRLPDHTRYTPMAESVLKPLLARVRELSPDLLISSGDFVEGCFASKPNDARREMEEGLSFFTALGLPFLISRGTHDAFDLFGELAVPAMGKSVSGAFTKTYLRHDVDECTFLVLDYQRFAVGTDQDIWLEEQLDEAREAGQRVFVVAHAPVYLWGRHFFGEPALMQRLDELFSAYPVEAYLCGHTHNQIVSFHAREGKHGWLQLMGSSVGYPAMAGQPLEQIHELADFGHENTYLWGIGEDSAPGLYVLDLAPDGLEIHWDSLTGERREFTVEGLRTQPVCQSAEPVPTGLVPDDLFHIKSGVLGVFSYSGNTPAGEVILNGIPLGPLPANGAYAARRFLALPDRALATIGQQNRLTIRTPDLSSFAIGSFVLELNLLDGRTIRSQVIPEILVSGDRWASFPGRRQLRPCAPNQTVDQSLQF
jgi:hypothetical protein